MMQLECSHNDDITRELKLLWIIFYKIKDARFLGKKTLYYISLKCQIFYLNYDPNKDFLRILRITWFQIINCDFYVSHY